MNKLFYLLGVLCLIFSFSSCNNTEGEGGTASIEGTLYAIEHADDNYNLQTDTIVAAKTDVFLVYGNEGFYGDDVETDYNGLYRFQYLTPGQYTLFTYSTLASGEREVVSHTVTLKRGERAVLPDLYIHEGKAYGTSIIKGEVWAQYIDKNGIVLGTGPAYEHRVYLQRVGEEFHIDDVRVGLDGTFMFQKVFPGSYTVFTISVDADEIPSIISQNIVVDEAGQIVTLPERFNVTIRP